MKSFRTMILSVGLAMGALMVGCGGAPGDEAQTEDNLAIGGGLAGGGGSGFDRCIDKCTDAYLDCQIDNPEGSLDRSLCDQRFNRCVAWCDFVYPATYATLRR